MTAQADLKAAAIDAIYERIIEHAPEASPLETLQLAEALAWIRVPGESHGGGGTTSTKSK